jgi:hypothetical protein
MKLLSNLIIESMKKLLLLSVVVLVTRLASAQSDFRSGTIYKNNGDSLTGEIDYRGDLMMGKICRFRMKADDSIRKFTPYDIAGYRFMNGKFFISKEINSQKYFLEFLIKGRVNVYYYRNNATDQYFVEKDSLGIMELPYQVMTLYKNDVPYQFKSTKHKGVLNLYMQDAPGFREKIEKIGEPDKEGLINLAKKYHDAMCPGEECLVFESKVSKVRLDVEFVLGASEYMLSTKNLDVNSLYTHALFENRTYGRGGLITHLWLPRINEKLYFRSGVTVSRIISNNTKHAMLQFPLQLEYMYSKGIIQPKAAYGLYLHAPFFLSDAALVGLNIKVDKGTSIALNYGIELLPFRKFPLFPTSSVFSHSLLAGLYFKF